MRNKRECIRHAVVLILAVAGLIICTAPSLTSSGLAWAQATAPNWSYTGSLNRARSGHTTTLLPNGKVLVAGGCSDSGGRDSAELYDPATGTWSYTGSLNTNRPGHSATRLQNGRVLVAGGFTANGDGINTAELYDPATGTWSYTGSLNRKRGSHTATLLPNGRYSSPADATVMTMSPAPPSYTTRRQERGAIPARLVPARLVGGGRITRRRCSKAARYLSREGLTPATLESSAPSCTTQRPGRGASAADSTKSVPVFTPQPYCQTAKS